MSLELNSELLIFSTLSLKESMRDDYRYDYNYWDLGKSIIDEIKNTILGAHGMLGWQINEFNKKS